MQHPSLPRKIAQAPAHLVPPPRRRYRPLGLVAALLAGLTLAGCADFKMLSLNWTRPGGQARPSADTPETADPPAKSEQDELADRVREYAERLDRQRQAGEQQGPSRRLFAQPTHGPLSDAPWSPTATAPVVDLGGPTAGAPTAAASATGPASSAGSPAAPSTLASPPALTPGPAAPQIAEVGDGGGRLASLSSPSDVVSSRRPVVEQQPAIITPRDEPPAFAPRFADAERLAAPPVVLASAPAAVAVESEPAGATSPPARPNGRLAVPGATASYAGRPIDEAIAAAEKTAAAAPSDFAAQLQLRMLYLSAGRTEAARAAWPGGSASQQQTLAAWVESAIALAARTSGGSGGAGDPGDAALSAVEALRRELAEQAPLKVRTVALVSRVDGFGVVAQFAEEFYRPGQWVIVYCELDNLSSRTDSEGRHRSELSLRVEVFSADGQSVARQDDPQVVDRSLNRRRDFFLARRLQLPASLSSGHYVLRVSVEDKQAAKVGEGMLRFQVR